MSKKKWCWGILSTANIGRTRFIPALQSIPNVEVVAVASRNLQKAETFAGECGIAEAYGSYQELTRTSPYRYLIQSNAESSTRIFKY